jgi:hypothetical protein
MPRRPPPGLWTNPNLKAYKVTYPRVSVLRCFASTFSRSPDTTPVTAAISRSTKRTSSWRTSKEWNKNPKAADHESVCETGSSSAGSPERPSSRPWPPFVFDVADANDIGRTPPSTRELGLNRGRKRPRTGRSFRSSPTTESRARTSRFPRTIGPGPHRGPSVFNQRRAPVDEGSLCLRRCVFGRRLLQSRFPCGRAA